MPARNTGCRGGRHMPRSPHFHEAPGSRVVLQSQRLLNGHVANCCLYEFEDLITRMESVSTFVPSRSYKVAKLIFRRTLALTRCRYVAELLRPEPNPLALERDYDLFFLIVPEKRDVFCAQAIRNWRHRCKKAACY